MCFVSRRMGLQSSAIRCCLLLLSYATVSWPGVAHAAGQAVPASSAAPATVLRAQVSQVVVDVVVTHGNGQPVSDLTQTNFSVSDNGKARPIEFFEAHGVDAAERMPSPLPPGTYANRMEVPPDSSVDVLLLDALNTEAKDQLFVRQQMVKYLRSVPPGRHIAVFTLASQLRLVKGFNTDSSTLLAALENGTLGNAQSSPLLQTQADRNSQQKDEDLTQENALAGANAKYAAQLDLQNLQQFESDLATFQTDLRVQFTLDALQQISRYLAGVPVRKNLIWLSASFPLSLVPDNYLRNPFQNVRNYSLELARTARMLSLARVAVYPVDARGLFSPNTFGANEAAGSSVRQTTQQIRDQTLAFEQDAMVRQTMESMARETGGEAIVNTNDLAGALHEIDGTAAHYYTLAYTPEDAEKEGKIHHLRIDVTGAKGSVQLLYRRSYVTQSAAQREQKHLSEADTHRLLLAAMAHRAPIATDLPFQVKVDHEGSSPAGGPMLGENSAVRPPAERYRMTYNADASKVDLQHEPDGTMQGSFLLFTVAYDRDGRVLNSQTSTLALRFPSAAYPQFLAQGIRFRQELDVPPAAVSLRAGVFDADSQAVGSLELPVAATSETHPAQ